MSQSPSPCPRDEASVTPRPYTSYEDRCNQGYQSSESHSNCSHAPSSPGRDWSIGSPALSITSIDPGSPSLRFKARRPATDADACGADDDGDWAADIRQKASNYLQYIESLSQAYESQLGALCAFFKACDAGQWETYTDEPIVKIVEVNKDGSRHLIGIDDIDTLIDHIGDQEREYSPEPQIVSSRVFLLDRVTPDVIGFFGAKLGVEPQFWNAHLTLAEMESTSSGQLVRYGDERGSRVSFLNIPLLRRCTSSEDIGRAMHVENDSQEEGSGTSSRLYEGCSIHLDYNAGTSEATTVLIITSGSDGHLRGCSKSLRTSFVEHLMARPHSVNPYAERASEDTISEAACTFALMLDLIKAIIHHLDSTLDNVPNHTNAEISNFTLNIFKDESDKMRRSILEEQDTISSLSKSLRVSLAAFDEMALRTSGGESATGVADKLQPLVQEFQDRSDRVRQWLQELDSAVVDHQRKRSAQLRRLKITLPVCSISLAVTIVIVFVTQFRIVGSTAKVAIDA
ncbi:hypothetical protein TWF696_002701 [Orbilia brochopaga]|uniref:Uncharacterized protein n=1 Tax=Orbilia brochopaga TaxID=3140254 RepID=A0AAV9U2D4_9PEZI